MAISRRFTVTPPDEVLLQIEAINVIDLAPPAPTVGVGTGNLLIVGEFEDGPFAAGGDSEQFAGDPGVLDVTSPEDYAQKFGTFGFTYGELQYQHPCARRRKGEAWNGNGYIKSYATKAQRLMISRVDTSTGSVVFQTRACVKGTERGPRTLTVGDLLTITTDQGGPASSTAIAAAVATVAGAGFALTSGFVGGERITVQIDGGPIVPIDFRVSDSTPAQVVARINAILGYTAAVENGGEVDLSGIVAGTLGEVTLAEVTAGALAAIGHVAGTTAGTGNVARLAAVTNTELANIINGTAGLSAIGVVARVDSDGQLVLCSDTAGDTGTIQVTSTALSVLLGLPTTLETSGVHDGGTIPAGTRVRAGVVEYVTMQTITIKAGTATAKQAGPFEVKVRPATDNGSDAGSAAAAVTTMVDQPTWGDLSVGNPSAISASLSEAVIDELYREAFEATIDLKSPAREANYSIAARSGALIAAMGKRNADDASADGMLGRKFIYGAELGLTRTQAKAEKSTLEGDRLIYTWPYWKVRIPALAVLGEDGGDGFTADGIIEVRSDSPLATLCCRLPPEENPGQATDLIDEFFAVSAPEKLSLATYIDLRKEGIAAPRVDVDDGPLYQSGLNTSSNLSRRNIARRAMADFIQDTLTRIAGPFSKKANKVARRTGVRAAFETFLIGLESRNAEDLSRIEGFILDEVSGNTDARLAAGIFVVITKVRTFASLDAIVIQTEIGENTVTSTTL